MLKRRTLMTAAMLLTTTSCVLATQLNNTMQSWEGHHYSELIMSWGPPQAVYDDGNGGRILIWTISRNWTPSPGRVVTLTNFSATVYDDQIWGQARSITEYRPPQTYGYTAWRMFQINAQGKIFRWDWQGL